MEWLGTFLGAYVLCFVIGWFVGRVYRNWKDGT